MISTRTPDCPYLFVQAQSFLKTRAVIYILFDVLTRSRAHARPSVRDLTFVSDFVFFVVAWRCEKSRRGGNVVAVLEMLNKKDGQNFTEQVRENPFAVGRQGESRR